MESNTTHGTPAGPTEEMYDRNKETEGEPRLVSVDEDDVSVDASDVDDHSTGMGEDDFLGKSNKENK
ncbi:hypothetical protein F5984_11335 [Rudanella paleaurantiibacter]|uniref:Uncharacterized protein n=1 Tax=Rudanella paleaurantiibacter TaxID=2614655 RepID=A0A7J5U0V1_9BACT|nr:hypothetical protein [Rudanella paleaurantiibacter]KAB7731378.1 hypothetical protein F5984_11335 [Rudanella paleaurantiibacter]